MEKQLFDYDGLDCWDEANYVFYNCRLIQPIGSHPVGTVFRSISVDYVEGTLTIWSEDGTEQVESFNLALQIIPNN